MKKGYTNREYKLSELLVILKERRWWSDDLRIDRIIVERHKCPDCKGSLEYRGFSNPNEYRAFGVCESCDYARRFWTETSDSATSKKNLAAVASSAEGAAIFRRRHKCRKPAL